MSLLRIKDGAIVSKQLVIAAAVVNAANVLGFSADMLVTSGRDGIHMPTSKHYADLALDFRTKQLTPTEKAELAAMVRNRLGPDYDVILESLAEGNEHLHVEFDPK
jgi:hypothetical protein